MTTGIQATSSSTRNASTPAGTRAPQGAPGLQLNQEQIHQLFVAMRNSGNGLFLQSIQPELEEARLITEMTPSNRAIMERAIGRPLEAIEGRLYFRNAPETVSAAAPDTPGVVTPNAHPNARAVVTPDAVARTRTAPLATGRPVTAAQPMIVGSSRGLAQPATSSTAQPVVAQSATPRQLLATAQAVAQNTQGEDFSFLDDPNMSIEEQLFMFATRMLERSDRELRDAMEQMRARGKQAASGSSQGNGANGTTSPTGANGNGVSASGAATASNAPTASGGGNILGSLLGGLGNLLGPIAPMIGMALGGPVGGLLGGAVQSLLPMLGNLFMGGGIGGAGNPGAGSSLVQQAANAGGTSNASEGTAAGNTQGNSGAGGASGESDTALQQRIQYLSQRRGEIAQMISSMLAAMHQTNSGIIGNIR